MPTSIATIMTLILTGITIAICIGFTITGDLPFLICVGVVIAVIIICIMGVFSTSTTEDPRD